ncbi:MAG: hypothetical protein EYC62_09360 [Alphaproteobacteria bacterium]|nr:MAG: hypothetical protein EYC62_09360 [Alphaproteobacteria bacterium]
MSDSNDVVQRRDDDHVADSASAVVEVNPSRTPKQDLWDIDDDIFRPLLDRVEEERRQEEREDAAHRALDQAEKLVSDQAASHLVDWGQGFSSSTTMEVPKINVGRRPVLSQAPGPVTIRSQQSNMPRVIWAQDSTPLKKITSFFENLNRRAQLVVSAGAIFLAWNVVALLCTRFASLAFFDFDPFFPRNWQMVYKLYNQGSTLQWSFVMFYMLMFAVVPLFGIMIAIKAAPEFRKILNAVLKPFYAVPKAITTILLRLMGVQSARPAEAPVARKPAYAAYNVKNYHGATFKKDKTEEDTTGGSVGGAGAGGGHGKPSWNMGPMNTQAFPRGEQGRR